MEVVSPFLTVLVDWLCVFAFFAMVVELFLGALNLIERLAR